MASTPSTSMKSKGKHNFYNKKINIFEKMVETSIDLIKRIQ